MRNIKISNREITIEKFQFSHTYSGLLAGTPSKDVNEKIIYNYQEALKRGNRLSVFHFTNNDYVSNEVLKPIIYTAWLDAEPINDPENEFDGSSVIVCWFGEDQIDKSISEIIIEGIADFDYDNSAVNYNF
ncbi:hypothetical protein [Flavobacterium sp. XS1P27]|uniref:hypothetical protein n=1 Tax=Flavobacterium sp. XS1P27 TaxID=3401724 RepID=UPI003AB0418B